MVESTFPNPRFFVFFTASACSKTYTQQPIFLLQLLQLQCPCFFNIILSWPLQCRLPSPSCQHIEQDSHFRSPCFPGCFHCSLTSHSLFPWSSNVNGFAIYDFQHQPWI